METLIARFAVQAKEFSRNPLGIISLFIVLVYGFACLLFGASSQYLVPDERKPLIWFIAGFPVIVLALFGWLVSKHHSKLYSPTDYRDDESFLRTSQLQFSSSKQEQKTETSREVLEELMMTGAGLATVKDEENKIKADLVSRELNVQGDTVAILIRHLAFSHVINWFEKTYGVIFGNQIRLLRLLNQERGNGLTKDDVKIFYNHVQKLYPDTLGDWALDNYLSYLFSRNLILFKDERFRITIAGSEFLTLLTNFGYSEKLDF